MGDHEDAALLIKARIAEIAAKEAKKKKPKRRSENTMLAMLLE